MFGDGALLAQRGQEQKKLYLYIFLDLTFFEKIIYKNILIKSRLINEDLSKLRYVMSY